MKNEYLWISRRFRVEKSTGRKWFCVGRARGFPPYVLDRLGLFETEGAAQARLDYWARRQGLRPVRH